MLAVAQPYFESDDFCGNVILHVAFPHPLLKHLILFECGLIVSCVLTIVPMLFSGILSLVLSTQSCSSASSLQASLLTQTKKSDDDSFLIFVCSYCSYLCS
jgi:hypothetical protein